ncbi:hypothetical protein L3Q82_001610 [Scortum barcoo]|uniref:Uncharacterized protein n=1 Tax=Scortum barcoo TaxID=214431 RepID=A0ACB8W4L9_9TELE|nr:hypothetical protein L3Q82_001610 [Scortum barcoo]
MEPWLHVRSPDTLFSGCLSATASTPGECMPTACTGTWFDTLSAVATSTTSSACSKRTVGGALLQNFNSSGAVTSVPAAMVEGVGLPLKQKEAAELPWHRRGREVEGGGGDGGGAAGGYRGPPEFNSLTASGKKLFLSLVVLLLMLRSLLPEGRGTNSACAVAWGPS